MPLLKNIDGLKQNIRACVNIDLWSDYLFKEYNRNPSFCVCNITDELMGTHNNNTCFIYHYEPLHQWLLLSSFKYY